MTKRQELELRSHDLTDKLNELESAATPDQAAIDAAQTEHREVREKLRDRDRRRRPTSRRPSSGYRRSEHRERLELRSRSTLGAFLLSAVLQGHDGRAAPKPSMRRRSAASDRGMIPIDLFEDRAAGDARRREVRADTATPAPATGTGVRRSPRCSPIVFAPSIAPRLGIDMPSVGSGSYSRDDHHHGEPGRRPRRRPATRTTRRPR